MEHSRGTKLPKVGRTTLRVTDLQMHQHSDIIRLYRPCVHGRNHPKSSCAVELGKRLTESDLELSAHVKVFREHDQIKWPPLVVHQETNCFDVWDDQVIVSIRDRNEHLYSFTYWLAVEYAYCVVLPGNVLVADCHADNFSLPNAWSSFSIVELKNAAETERNLKEKWLDLDEHDKTIHVGNLGAPGMLPSRRTSVYVEAGDFDSASKHQSFIFKQNRRFLPQAQERIQNKQLGRGLISAAFWELTTDDSAKYYAYECGGFGQSSWLEFLAENVGMKTAQVRNFDCVEFSSGCIEAICNCRFEQVRAE